MKMLSRQLSVLIFILIIFISINVFVNIKKTDTGLLNYRSYSLLNAYTQEFTYNYNYISAYKNSHEYKYILNPIENACRKDKITLLALVTSAAGNFENRSAIRRTWSNSELFPGLETVFILGKSKNQTINFKIKNESKIYGDIIQEDFIDSYKNLTIKTIAAMKWAANYCSNNTKFILKVDDDMIVNSYALIPYLEVFDKPVKNSLFCLPNMHVKVDRNVTSKFYITRKTYSAEYYPSYCNGGAYILSPDLPKKFYETSSRTKLFVFEDVYIGMLAEKLKTNIVNLTKNYCWNKSGCFYALHRKIEKIYFFFLNGLEPQMMLNGWLEITEKMMEVISGKPRIEPKFL